VVHVEPSPPRLAPVHLPRSDVSEYRKYKQHTVATPDPRWERFGKVAEALGTDRSKLLNTVMAWYGREEGVTLPRRPERLPE
jgi:hypothetical protein